MTLKCKALNNCSLFIVKSESVKIPVEFQFPLRYPVHLLNWLSSLKIEGGGPSKVPVWAMELATVLFPKECLDALVNGFTTVLTAVVAPYYPMCNTSTCYPTYTIITLPSNEQYHQLAIQFVEASTDHPMCGNIIWPSNELQCHLTIQFVTKTPYHPMWNNSTLLTNVWWYIRTSCYPYQYFLINTQL